MINFFSDCIGVNKTGVSKEYIIFYYWYFFDKAIKFQPAVSNGGYDISIISKSFKNIAILNIYGVYY